MMSVLEVQVLPTAEEEQRCPWAAPMRQPGVAVSKWKQVVWALAERAVPWARVGPSLANRPRPFGYPFGADRMLT